MIIDAALQPGTVLSLAFPRLLGHMKGAGGALIDNLLCDKGFSLGSVLVSFRHTASRAVLQPSGKMVYLDRNELYVDLSIRGARALC